jgi:flagellar basal body-associated protein FliL
MKNSYTKINLITIVIVLFVPQIIQLFFKFMKQSKNHGTPNQQPQPLYTPLLAYYFEIN